MNLLKINRSNFKKIQCTKRKRRCLSTHMVQNTKRKRRCLSTHMVQDSKRKRRCSSTHMDQNTKRMIGWIAHMMIKLISHNSAILQERILKTYLVKFALGWSIRRSLLYFISIITRYEACIRVTLFCQPVCIIH